MKFRRSFSRATTMNESKLVVNDLSKGGLTKTIFSHLYGPATKLFLLPMFLIIGGMIAGSLTDDQGESELMLAGFGLGELSVTVLSLTVLHAFNRNIKRDFEAEQLRGDNVQMQVLLYQQILLDTLVFLITMIPFYAGITSVY